MESDVVEAACLAVRPQEEERPEDDVEEGVEERKSQSGSRPSSRSSTRNGIRLSERRYRARYLATILAVSRLLPSARLANAEVRCRLGVRFVRAVARISPIVRDVAVPSSSGDAKVNENAVRIDRKIGSKEDDVLWSPVSAGRRVSSYFR